MSQHETRNPTEDANRNADQNAKHVAAGPARVHP